MFPFSYSGEKMGDFVTEMQTESLNVNINVIEQNLDSEKIYLNSFRANIF
jgi:hypothetical protein